MFFAHKYTFLSEQNDEYNKSMNYVDNVDGKIGDQPHKNNNIALATMKQLIQFAASNAHAIWQVLKKTKIGFREFLEMIILQYLQNQKKKEFPMTSHSPAKNKLKDFTFHSELHEIVSANGSQKKCSACNHNNSYAKTYCKTCSGTKNGIVYVHKKCLYLHIDKVKEEKENKKRKLNK